MPPIVCVCVSTSLTVTTTATHIRIYTKANLDALTSVLETRGQQQQRCRGQEEIRACVTLSGCESAWQRSVSFARQKPLLERIRVLSLINGSYGSPLPRPLRPFHRHPKTSAVSCVIKCNVALINVNRLRAS